MSMRLFRGGSLTCFLGLSAGVVFVLVGDIAHAGPADQVRIRATICEIDGDGTRRVVANPTLVVPMNEWAVFEDGGTVTLPASHTLPSIPVELADEARLERESKEAANWVTNERQLVVPAQPESFTKRDFGLITKFRPRETAGGDLVIDCTIEETRFLGLVNRSNPIVVERPRLGSKSKEITLTENARPEGRFAKQTREIQFVPDGDGHSPERVSESMTPEEMRENLPEITVDLSAERILREKANPKTKPDFENPAVYLTVKVIEVTGEPGPPVPFDSQQSVFSEREFPVWFRSLSQQKGIDLLSAPSVLTYPGQAATVEVVREFIYPTEYDPPEIDRGEKRDEPGSFAATPATPVVFETVNTGVVIEFLPRLRSDGRIELSMEPRVTEFDRFLNLGNPIVKIDPTRLKKNGDVIVTENRMEMPQFLHRGLKTTASIADGQTIVLGGLIREDIQTVEDKVPVLGDLPLVGSLARSESELLVVRHLYFAIGAQLVEGTKNP